MTKKPRVCHSERSEESRVLMGQIINESSNNIFTYTEPALTVGILPRPKARSE